MTLEERFDALLAVPEFQDLPAEALSAMAAGMREERFRPGETVVAAGEPADRVFVLCGAALEVTQPGRDGVVRRLGSGTLLGRVGLLRRHRTHRHRASRPAEHAAVARVRELPRVPAAPPGQPADPDGRIVRTLMELEHAASLPEIGLPEVSQPEISRQ